MADAGSKNASASASMPDAGQAGDAGLVQLHDHGQFVALEIDGVKRDELLALEAFPLPAGSHVLRLVSREGQTVNRQILLRAGETLTLSTPYCEPRLGGVPPYPEPRPKGCCGGAAATADRRDERSYGPLASLAAVAVFARRRKRR